ncbi:MAG: Uma2 family endonuclease [Microcoleus sp. PH2017_29_MFU_D_A]|uniref:Uma2 family endonuclease n=1 Tax=unclassified Microcoleus TaxID=2642155 RepID=UPI001DD61DC3|nr:MULTISPECIES: Uma2 family endonuclease [unclassified Microcoleus]TAE10814.1 MAG: Uma2 family endonuclease [Oscillatoriales cyanobacterium]MCC3453518.1 Uma2 family endonuclease [Microcoleus sp. PH2017_08_TRC_O_A]MCC3473533.1 Uma2 family endonuclease [Microcoleus sp. PH2017_13_LAR_U_A]MCC3485923.1 Uma2 family endonuclease [Microcoleus sp. PH2017_14_LAR_D_A]MCC3491926.1 Uma2 family endonuclease [Microcoleus sp. PH2017_16_JOR_D_A]
MTIATERITLEEFLKLPETKPASEYIEGEIIQKPMPKTKHSLLQLRSCNEINQVTQTPKIAYAFPELRCTFGGRSIVPDVAVLLWEQIQFDDSGEPLDDVLIAPYWAIEILSPEQSSNRVTKKIIHCLEHGCQLGWLVDPGDRSILAFLPNQQPQFCEGSDVVPVPEIIPLNITAEQVFSWLRMQASTTGS